MNWKPSTSTLAPNSFSKSRLIVEPKEHLTKESYSFSFVR